MKTVFRAYDTLEGARCQTIRSKVMTQKEAALLAAKRTGLNQISEIDAEWFAGREKEYDMFINRLKVLL